MAIYNSTEGTSSAIPTASTPTVDRWIIAAAVAATLSVSSPVPTRSCVTGTLVNSPLTGVTDPGTTTDGVAATAEGAPAVSDKKVWEAGTLVPNCTLKTGSTCYIVKDKVKVAPPLKSTTTIVSTFTPLP